MSHEELRPKPFHIIPGIGIDIIGKNCLQSCIIILGPALDHFFGNRKPCTLRKEGDHLVSNIGGIDMLAVEVHNFLTILALRFGSNILAERTYVPPRCPL
jgi:hypothetical protein